jgi:hypothetical protein
MRNKIDATIRKLYKQKDWVMLQVYIYEHCKNFKNNADKYLVIIDTQWWQPHQWVATDIEWLSIFNDKKYELPQCKEYDSIAFVIVWWVEIWEFMESIWIE